MDKIQNLQNVFEDTTPTSGAKFGENTGKTLTNIGTGIGGLLGGVVGGVIDPLKDDKTVTQVVQEGGGGSKKSSEGDKNTLYIIIGVSVIGLLIGIFILTKKR